MIRFSDPETQKRETKRRPADKIIAGLREAISVAKGETKPARVAKPKANRSNAQSNTPDAAPKFDKMAYQRELMRKRRAAKKASGA